MTSLLEAPQQTGGMTPTQKRLSLFGGNNQFTGGGMTGAPAGGMPLVAGAIPPATEPLAALAPEDVFFHYVRPIGIGGIFAAGILSILKMSPVIVQATRQALGEVGRLLRHQATAVAGDRTDRGLPMSVVLAGIAATALAVFLYFRLSVLAAEPSATSLALAAAGLALVIAFLFAAVSAWVRSR